MNELLQKCELCPQKCGINRYKGNGKCGANSDVKIALASIHNFEEPCISGEKGSGTIFFSHCNLKCVYCQNYKISKEGFGKYISIEHLSEIFISQQEKKVHNINLVTPTMYIPQIIEAITIARNKGLKIPIVYNCSGYENVGSLRLLEGYIDVYLPDLKYYDGNLAFRLSGINNYFKVATECIEEMLRQVGTPKLDKNGIIQKGLIIRHMILPNNVENSKNILKWINENIPKEVYISIMAQYFPAGNAKKIEEINRKITREELKEVEDYLYDLEIENGYIQELGEHEEEYVPNFDLSE